MAGFEIQQEIRFSENNPRWPTAPVRSFLACLKESVLSHLDYWVTEKYKSVERYFHGSHTSASSVIFPSKSPQRTKA